MGVPSAAQLLITLRSQCISLSINIDTGYSSVYASLLREKLGGTYACLLDCHNQVVRYGVNAGIYVDSVRLWPASVLQAHNYKVQNIDALPDTLPTCATLSRWERILLEIVLDSHIQAVVKYKTEMRKTTLNNLRYMRENYTNDITPIKYRQYETPELRRRAARYRIVRQRRFRK